MRRIIEWALEPRVRLATARGTMWHKPGCSVIAGRCDLRQVTERDRLGGCSMCGTRGVDEG